MKHLRMGLAPRSRANERGYSLIELSIAMLIAIFLLGGLLSIVQGQHRTSTNQTLLAQLQDNERLAMTLMTDVIQQAGYYSDPAAPTLEAALGTDGTFATAGQSIAGGPGAVATDTLVVRYRAGSPDSVLNCIGGSNNSGAPFTFVNTFDVDATGHLTCSSTTPAGVVKAQLVSGVTNLQILYGVNTGSTSANSNCPADRYLGQVDMTNALYWTNVCTIKVTITFTNPLRQPVPGIPPDTTQPATITFSRVVGIMSKVGVDVVNVTVATPPAG